MNAAERLEVEPTVVYFVWSVDGSIMRLLATGLEHENTSRYRAVRRGRLPLHEDTRLDGLLNFKRYDRAFAGANNRRHINEPEHANRPQSRR